MANITMCLSKDCPRRTQCYRAMARQINGNNKRIT